MTGHLTVHVIGSGFGESVILSLPDGSVGVIDCCSPSLKVSEGSSKHPNPTLRFLQENLQAERLAFLALTHPHEDHGRGISHLLTVYRDRIDEVWVFDAYQHVALERYFLALFNDARKLPVEKLLGQEPGTFSAELLRIRELIKEQAARSRASRAKLRRFRGIEEIQFGRGAVTVRILGPSVALATEYESNLVENLRGVVDSEGFVVDRSWKHDAVNHNLASPAFAVEYGETRIVLGADMEQPGWRELMADEKFRADQLACQLIKVCHHGSETGYVDEVYAMLCAEGAPIGVLTPFSRHSRPLPQRDSVELLCQNVSELWVTSVEHARRSLGLMEPLSEEELFENYQRLQRWRELVKSRPALAGAFDPSAVTLFGKILGPVADSLPAELLQDIAEVPRLAALIHPTLRLAIVDPPRRQEPIEHHYRLSFTFDDKGGEDTGRRYIGERCGRIDSSMW